MPFKSLKQERWGHTASGEKALGGKNKLNEWDQASKSKDFPMVAPKSASLPQIPNSSLTPPSISTKHGFSRGGDHVEVGSERG